MRRGFAIVVVMFAISGTAIAQQEKSAPRKLDGINLLRSCDEPESHPKDSGLVEAAVDRGYCLGVVRGVSFWLLPKGCSDDVSMGQRVLVVTKYLKDHPEALNLPDALLVSTALSKAFPCPTSHIR